jgi:hypothetical protein
MGEIGFSVRIFSVYNAEVSSETLNCRSERLISGTNNDFPFCA